jgi:hypothetical protein
MASIQNTQSDKPQLRDGLMIGPWHRPKNPARSDPGAIHDDATAMQLGFKGDPVTGISLMELFPPLLLSTFGPRWFERGTLSMYFVHATTEREPVRASLEQPSPGATNTQCNGWVEAENALRVIEGTASAGDATAPTYLQQRLAKPVMPGELRILKDVQPGHAFDAGEVSLDARSQAARLAALSEPLAWFAQDSPWGAPIATLGGMNDLLYRLWLQTLSPAAGGAVDLYGAIELRNINGPVFVDQTYRVHGKVVSVGQSPKTEYLWFETLLSDRGGRPIAGLLMQMRWMKASSALWQ